MNKPNFVFIVGAACMLAPAPSTLAQTAWQTVDDFNYGSAKAAGNRCVTTAPNGAIFVSGGASGNGLVHRSMDGGDSWEVVLDVPNANFLGITVAPSGSVFAVGPTVRKWITYRSTDNGATWTLVDSVPSPTSATPWAASTDAAGRIYVCGEVAEGNGYSHWQVRRSTDDGFTWAIADDFRAAGATIAKSIAITPSSIAVAGSMSGIWAVRRSSNGGVTWTTSEKFQLDSRYTSYASAVTAAADGPLYVTGMASTRTDMCLVTRKTINGGLTWQTVDSVTLNHLGVGKGICADAFGRIFAVGCFGNPARWVTRASLNGGATWFTSDNFALSTGSAQAWSAAVDAQGNVLVVGDSIGADGINHAVVRKQAVP